MRRWLIVLSLFLSACQGSRLPLPTPIPSLPVSPAPTFTATAAPAATATPSPEPTLPAQENTPAFTVLYHPDGALYVGDLISIEIIAPPDLDLKGDRVHIAGDSPAAADLGSAEFNPYGIGGRFQATLFWTWDTSDLTAGDHSLTFTIPSKDIRWTETLTLLPADSLPPSESNAHWDTVTTACCAIHYITGTDAARDLPTLAAIADEQARDAIQRLEVAFSRPVSVTILPRVLGHGGFASSEIYVSYLDHNYTGNDFAQVLHHEMIHILDGRLGGEFRPSLLVEGLAVYLSQGHYRREPLLGRAAALLELGWYIPLPRLADDFYTSQHEIGYLEGGALVQFMVNTWGWQAYSDFYRDIQSPSSGRQSDALDAALQTHFGLSLLQLDQRFRTWLHRQHLNPDLMDDVRLTVMQYDTLRRYQQTLDPSAYFLTVWLPDGNTMREHGMVADYLRHPTTPQNVALETMLMLANANIWAGDYLDAEKILKVISDSHLK